MRRQTADGRELAARPGLHRIRAERALREDFGPLRAGVLAAASAKLAACGVRLDRADLDACYGQAWQGLYAQLLAGERVANPRGWLVLATYRRAIEEWRLLHVDRRASGEQEPAASTADPAERLDDLEQLRSVFEALRGRLTPRECQAATLCYLHGLTRAEAAERLGVSERRMRKLMEGDGAGRPGVAGKVAGLVLAIREGRWCEQQGSLIRAYAYGMLDPDGGRHGLAVAHLQHCPACRAYVCSLRALSAIVPPGVLPGLLGTGLAGTGLAVGAGAGGGAAPAAAGAGVSGGWLVGGSGLAKVAAGALAALAVAGAGATLAVHGGRPSRPGRAATRHAAPRRVGVSVPERRHSAAVASVRASARPAA
ncbi:MAG TPA: sigma-70 family RNA polymerase sigma factor, partial [Solirubrobacteraceae bacterium]|nr:sigma-70 family RNA polymerase sigma factor [Solirubrobacteraceae bacterium]